MGNLFSWYFNSTETKCGWCLGLGHRLAFCPGFKPFKDATSNNNYVSKNLGVRERIGYCTSGILPIYVDHVTENIYVFMIQETRDGVSLFNPIGGKRESRVETVEYTAIRELNEEYNSKAVIHDYPILFTDFGEFRNSVALWYAKGKYVLYSYLVEGIVDVNADYSRVNCKWIKLINVTDETVVFPFTREMITSLDIRQLINTNQYMPC
jgi:8-oxo-dGTP pyrophosphatase MutT (NUDIX family)